MGIESWLIARIYHPTRSLRLTVWSWLGLGLGIFLLKKEYTTIGTVVWGVGWLGFAIACLLWAAPMERRFRDRAAMVWFRKFLLLIAGVFSTISALGVVARVTGFPPGDYPFAVSIIAIICFVQVLFYVAFIVVLLSGVFVAISFALVPKIDGLSDEVKSWAKDWNDHWVSRSMSLAGLLALIICSAYWFEIYTQKPIDGLAKRIIVATEYHHCYNHPLSNRRDEIHFHENGIITRVLEKDKDLVFESFEPMTKNK